MITTSSVRVASGLFVVCGALLARRWHILIPALFGLVIFFLATRQFATLRRCAITMTPIVMMFLGIQLMSRVLSSAQFQTPWLTILRLCTLMLAFSYTTVLFEGQDGAEKLIDLGLKNNGLIIALSAISTLPLMQSTARRITEARFAAGFIGRRSIFATATQLPYILGPLFTQALRLAIARSDTWHQRELSHRLQQNLAVIHRSRRVRSYELLTALLPATWIVFIIVTEFL
jgi:hypothetical protein